MLSHPGRRGYLDWLRGVGVLIMIEAHTLDSWTQLADRTRPAYRWAIVLGGFGAPIFLFLAGMAIAMAAHARARRGMPERDAGRLAMRRAWQVFGYAFLFRLQSLLISGGGLRAFLKVDILNIMGVSMVIAAALWSFSGSRRGRVALFVGATVIAAMLTPPVRATPWLAWLPDALEAYLRPDPGRSTFTLFPWGGFLFAGVVAGLWLDSGDRDGEPRRVLWLSLSGVLIGGAGYGASYLPPIYEQTSYWTSSPTFFFVRLGIIAALIGLAFVWSGLREGGRSRLQEFGVASLFVYWIHVEMVYGVLSTPLHRRLTLEQAVIALVAFSGFLYGLVQVKNRVIPGRRAGEKSTGFESYRATPVADRTHSG